MRYLLVDRILEWKPGQSIRGIKNVAMSEDFLEFHFPGKPVMPGLLLLEALVQLAGWLEAVSSEFNNWLLLERVERCMFYDFTVPGDGVELEVRVRSESSSATKVFAGYCAVDGKRKIAAEFSAVAVALDHLEEVQERKKHFQLLTRSEFLP